MEARNQKKYLLTLFIILLSSKLFEIYGEHQIQMCVVMVLGIRKVDEHKAVVLPLSPFDVLSC